MEPSADSRGADATRRWARPGRPTARAVLTGGVLVLVDRAGSLVLEQLLAVEIDLRLIVAAHLQVQVLHFRIGNDIRQRTLRTHRPAFRPPYRASRRSLPPHGKSINKRYAEGVRHEFHLYPGGHSAEYFLGHLGETIEFHWHAFEKAGR